MPKYSKSSSSKLATAHQDLQTIFNYVIKDFDNTILFGHRTAEEQFELYKKGRRLDRNGLWIIYDKRKVVTYCDGLKKKSKHNENLSLAVDACPWPINFKDEETIYHFAGIVLGWAAALKKYGAIEHDIIWGGNWDDDSNLHDQNFYDLLHFQIKK